jgi:signal transduction histidine kinase
VAGRIFEPFLTTKRTGTGLGLAIGRKVIEAHGGTLSWLPNVPRGTRMLVRLPIAEPPVPPGP